MIFFGLSKPKKTVVKPLGMASCPDCREEGYLDVFGYARYFHLYWIPMFSIGKSIRTNCRNCDTTFKGEKMPKAAAIYADELKKEVKIPFWHFSGIGVVVGLIFFMVSIGRNGDKLEAKYLGNPQMNDVYFMNTDDGYTYWKLINIERDTLMFHQSGLYVESIFDISDITKSPMYMGDTLKYSSSDVKWMFDENEIYRIERE
jgi:hypothetical protein